MCGRFYNHLSNMHKWVEILGDWPGEGRLSYNISPTALVPIILGSGRLVEANWGLIPSWSKEFKSNYATHNARIESAHEKPAFRSAWKQSRTCLIPAGGYYEWKKEGSVKQPYAVHDPEGIIMMAGLWEQWGEKISFTILTEASKGQLSDLHHRMPLMLDEVSASSWLNEGISENSRESVVFENLHVKKVSTKVNNSRAEGEDLIEPID